MLGLILAKHGQFSPEILSVQASRVLALEIIIIIMEVLALYVINIQSSLFVLDLIAYSGYKYLGYDNNNILVTVIYNIQNFNRIYIYLQNCKLCSIWIITWKNYLLYHFNIHWHCIYLFFGNIYINNICHDITIF